MTVHCAECCAPDCTGSMEDFQHQGRFDTCAECGWVAHAACMAQTPCEAGNEDDDPHVPSPLTIDDILSHTEIKEFVAALATSEANSAFHEAYERTLYFTVAHFEWHKRHDPLSYEKMKAEAWDRVPNIRP